MKFHNWIILLVSSSIILFCFANYQNSLSIKREIEAREAAEDAEWESIQNPTLAQRIDRMIIESERRKRDW
jgi:hypothetical protein